MDVIVNDVSVHYAEHGAGTPLVALHGAGVDHREIEAALEAVVPPQGLRRIYPDLPGMGRTRGTGGLSGNADVVRLIGDVIDELVGGPALLLGHSYGAYVARGVAANRPELVLGLALLCPIGEHSGELPAPSVARTEPDAYAELTTEQRAGFDDYFVVRTPDTARRYRDHVVPGVSLVDEAELGRIFADWHLELGSEPFEKPALIVAGRRDATAGYASAVELLDQYRQATLAVLDDAGHALPHEQPTLLGALLADWFDRAISA